nr:hypothetical protein [Evansella caseinilytica]
MPPTPVSATSYIHTPVLFTLALVRLDFSLHIIIASAGAGFL